MITSSSSLHRPHEAQDARRSRTASAARDQVRYADGDIMNASHDPTILPRPDTHLLSRSQEQPIASQQLPTAFRAEPGTTEPLLLQISTKERYQFADLRVRGTRRSSGTGADAAEQPPQRCRFEPSKHNIYVAYRYRRPFASSSSTSRTVPPADRQPRRGEQNSASGGSPRGYVQLFTADELVYVSESAGPRRVQSSARPAAPTSRFSPNPHHRETTIRSANDLQVPAPTRGRR